MDNGKQPGNGEIKRMKGEGRCGRKEENMKEGRSKEGERNERNGRMRPGKKKGKRF
jgi:hypothetical protein